MTVQQTITFDLQVTVTLQARAVSTDFGVPGSPVWDEFEDHDYADYTIEVDGYEIKLDTLGDDMRKVVLGAAIEVANDEGWE